MRVEASSAGTTISVRHFSILHVSDSAYFHFTLTTVKSVFYLFCATGILHTSETAPAPLRGRMGCHSGLASIPIFAFLERIMDVCIEGAKNILRHLMCTEQCIPLLLFLIIYYYPSLGIRYSTSNAASSLRASDSAVFY